MEYTLMFSPSPTPFVINTAIDISNRTAYFVGDFNQGSGGSITIQIEQNKSGKLNFTGCATFNGTITLIVNTKPVKNTTYEIFSFTCPQSIKISDSQIKVTKNYKSCENLKHGTSSSQISLSVSLSSGGCGNNIGLIIGLAVGIPSFLILLVVGVVLFLKYKINSDSNKFQTEQQNKVGEFVENKNFTNPTIWKGNIEMDNI